MTAKMSQRALARARDEFFASGVVHPSVRPDIVRSWRRCVQLGIDPGSTTTPHFVEPQRTDALRRAADPVVRRLLTDVGEDRAAMLLLNADGVVVERWSASARINRTLDDSSIARGRLFDEASAGTTGLGTPLENGRSVLVEGAEHALSALDSLTAVGTPVLHPTRGTLEGVIDIVGTLGVEPTMMVPLIARAARDIGERLVAGYAAEDRELLDAFLLVERRGPRRPVLAVNERIVIGNGPGNELNLAATHHELWSLARSALATHDDAVLLERRSGEAVHGHVVPVGDSAAVGALLHVDGVRRATPPEATGAGAVRRPRNETAFDQLDRLAIRRALQEAGGNKRRAAELLGVSRATLYRMMSRLHMPN